ncbi:hypothetical protein F5051DRAFT_201495 [Lentinula edodes]|nr:hypothetical protein F5051DRAFT_201495 [Lentinula edodes]
MDVNGTNDNLETINLERRNTQALYPGDPQLDDMVALFANNEFSALQGTQLDTERRDTRTAQEKNELLRWAKEFDASHPYISREELARRRQATSASLQSSVFPSRSSRTSQGLQLFDTERRNDVLIEKSDLLRWAEEFDASHPYIPREELERRRKAKEEERAKTQASF